MSFPCPYQNRLAFMPLTRGLAGPNIFYSIIRYNLHKFGAWHEDSFAKRWQKRLGHALAPLLRDIATL